MSGGYNTNPGSLQVSKGQVIFMRTYVLRSDTTETVTYGVSTSGNEVILTHDSQGYGAPMTRSNFPPVPSVATSGMMDTHNLPNLEWYVWLDTIYTYVTSLPPGLPAVSVTHYPQNNIRFVPIMSEGAARAGPPILSVTGFPAMDPSLLYNGALPVSAPIVLPIGIPITVKRTAATTSMGVYFMLPITANAPPAALSVGTYNRVHVVLSASA